MVGILFDVTRCCGCERCVAACVEANGCDPAAAERDRATTRDGLSANRLLTVLPVGSGRFARLACMHCLEPSCVAACLVGGLQRTPEGPIVYDPEKCIGCRYCMLACPFHVPRYEWQRTAPLVRKCSMCRERLQEGTMPACVEACPNDAMLFGQRDELMREAHQRIRAYPGRYLPRVWGETDFGGTSVLFLSDVDLRELGWPREPADPIPALTDPLIHETPYIGLSVALGCWGLTAIIRRRNKLMAARAATGGKEPVEDD
jgi:Fe-S-cluster-containing dehydrogenase component